MKDEELPILTLEEEKAAIIEGRKKKWFHEKHKDYWFKAEFESKKGPVKQLMK